MLPCGQLFVLLLAAGDPPLRQQLVEIKRVFVAELTGGGPAAQMRELIIASLQNAKLFILTEDEKSADAVLKGAAADEVFTENHNIDDSISGRVGSSRGRGATASSRINNTRDYDSGSVSIGERESSHIQERRHEAMATVRLVLKNGDVVWSTTQESGGAKFRGASADVAGKIARQLTLDLERAARKPAATAAK